MDFIVSESLEERLQVLPTPWGKLVGLKADHISRTILNDGQYEWAETAIVSSLLRTGATAFDVGANIGYYTALFRTLVGAKGAVHAFEANPLTTALLKRSGTQNDWSGVVINNVAAGAVDATLKVRAMNLGEALSNDRLNLGGWNLNEASDGEWEVPVITLDRYVVDHNLERVHMLKVDVEGFELKVLEGADILMKKLRPYLIMEMRADSDIERLRCEQVSEFLQARDFTCCRIMKRPFPHFRSIGDTELSGEDYHFNMLAMPSSRYREFYASFNWQSLSA